jgi:hypothetical protein
MTYELPPLRFGYHELEPYFSEEMVRRIGNEYCCTSEPVCTENLICVGGTTESPKLTE